LHHCPDNGQATRFCRESVNLIRALSDMAKETFNGIGAVNGAMHDRRESIKGQQMLFIFGETAYRFWIALLVLGFEGRHIEQRILFLPLLEDPGSFWADLFALAMSNSIEDMALFMHHTALSGSGWKQRGEGCQQSLMPIGDDQVDLGRPSIAQVL